MTDDENHMPIWKRPIRLSWKWMVPLFLVLVAFVCWKGYGIYLRKSDPLKYSIKDKIGRLETYGTALPQCPLIYPLLNEMGQVTALGSYLSYLAMKQASYVPNSVLSLRNAGNFFNQMDLFRPEARDPGRYKEQLPYMFQTDQVVDGYIISTGKGKKIKLVFRNSKSQSRLFAREFEGDSLHQAPAWMASCLHEWLGSQITSEQKQYMDDALFKNDADLWRAASLEWVFRSAPELVSGWEDILAKNPKSPLLLDRWLAIIDRRANVTHIGAANNNFRLEPRSTILKLDRVARYIRAQNYIAALDIIFPELQRDELNQEWYLPLRTCLRSLGYWEEAKNLFDVLLSKHPDSTNLNLDQAILLRDYAWRARGGGYAGDVSNKSMSLYEERILEGLTYAQRAAELSPGRAKPWNILLWYGISVGWSQEQQDEYFQKVLDVDPNYSVAYLNYLEYIKPKWYGVPGQTLEFAEKYVTRVPMVMVYACLEEIRVYQDKFREESLEVFKVRLKNAVKDHPLQDKYVDAYKVSLKRYPTNISNWIGFYIWMGVMDRNEELFEFLEQICQGSLEMKLLYPYIRLAFLSHDRSQLPSAALQVDFDKNPAILREKANMNKMISDLNPTNWTAWNHQAKLWIALERPEKARAALLAIGANWDESVWRKGEFQKAQLEHATVGVKP